MGEDRLTRLYREYGPVIYGRCQRLLGDDALAEDATQETFLRVLRHLESSPAPEEALTWICRIATNYCLNQRRDDRRHAHSLNRLPERPLPPHMEACLADREFAARLILQAPAKIRAVAWLHHVDGLDQTEVARVLGISRRSVLNHLATFTRNAHKFLRREVL